MNKKEAQELDVQLTKRGSESHHKGTGQISSTTQIQSSQSLTTQNKKHDLLSCLYGPDYQNKKPIYRLWRKFTIVSYFVSFLLKAHQRLKLLGVVRRNQIVILNRNRSEGEIEDIETRYQQTKRKKYLIYQDSKFRYTWNSILVFLLLSTAILTPFNVSFINDDPIEWVLINAFFDIMFGIDMMVSFFSVVQIGDKMEDNWRKIAINYLTGWFFIDLIVIMPFNLIIPQNEENGSSFGDYNQLLRLLRLPRLTKLFNMLKRKGSVDVKLSIQITRLLSKIQIGQGVVMVFEIILNILLVNHIVGCFWHLVPELEDSGNQSWLAVTKFGEKSIYRRYTASFYWAITTITTVGYGDILPGTSGEKVYAILVMFFGIGYFSYTLGKLSSVMASMDNQGEVFNRKLNNFLDFALKVQLPNKMRNQVMDYYQSNFNQGMYSFLNATKFISQLPNQTKKELITSAYQFLKDEIVLFRIDPSFTCALIEHLYCMEVNEGDIIYREGDLSTDIYFLASGKIGIFLPTGQSLLKMIDGCYFGQAQAIDGENRKFYAVALSQCFLYFCNREPFINLVKMHQEVHQSIENYIAKRQQKYLVCHKVLEFEGNKNKSKNPEELSNQKKFNQNLVPRNQYFLNFLIKNKEEKLQEKAKKMFKLQKTVETQQERIARIEQIRDSFTYKETELSILNMQHHIQKIQKKKQNQ